MRTRALGLYALVALVTTALLPLLLDLTPLSVPFEYANDALSGSAHVKTVLERGWISYNPSLGAPEGRHGNDFPGADNLHLMVVWVLGLFVHRWAVVLNAYFLLTFPLCAVAGTWFFRVVGLRRLTAGALGVLYAYAPYHLQRGEHHLYLAAYYVVPLAGVVLWRVTGGEPLWGRRGWSTAACLVLLGTASSYYSIFALALLPLAALVGTRTRRTALGVVSAAALLMAVMVANMLPNLLYERSHGANLTALVRSGRLTEFYGLKLSQLLLPVPGHRLQPLADLRRTYDATYPLPSELPALGLVAAVGLVVLLVTLVVGRSGEQRRLAVLSLGAFLLGTVGGVATLFALLVTDSVRGWNRISVYLALFALASVGLLLDRVRWRAVVVPLVLVVGLLDEVPGTWPPDRAQVVRAWASDEAFVRQAEALLPSGAMVLQLPYLAYPESSGRLRLEDSDPLRMYLHSKDLRWSYGGVKGRPESDWLRDLPEQTAAPLAAIAGFDALVLDRFGYADRSFETSLGRASATSADGRFVLFDLRPVRAAVQAVASERELSELAQHVLLHPVAYAVGFAAGHPRIALENPLPTAQVVDATVTLLASDRPSRIALAWPDGTVQEQAPVGSTAVWTRRLTLPPGRSWVDISTPAGATTPEGLRPAQVRYRLRSATVPDEVLSAFRPIGSIP